MTDKFTTMLGILALFVAAFACNPTTPTFLVVEAAPAPPQKCTTDFHCPEKMFCRSSMICGACADCMKVNRHPPANGDDCAKGTSECGACLEGFKEIGGHCADAEDGNNSSEEVLLVTPKTKPQREGGPPDTDLALYWVLTIVSILLTILVVFGFFKLTLFVKGKLRSRHRHVSLSGERGEESIKNPSAPLLEEYSQPPAYVVPSLHSYIPDVITGIGINKTFHSPPVNYCVASATVQAAPFNVGNGAGEWAEAEEVQDFAEIIAADLENVQPPENENANNDDNLEEEDLQNLPANENVNNVIQDIFNENVPQQMDEVMENGMDLDLEDEAAAQGLEPLWQPEQELPELYLDFSVFFTVGFSTGRERSQSGHALAIDDTHLDLSTVANFSASSQASSNLSMAQSSDSGTGTSNEDDIVTSSPTREVPSTSTANDIHYYDDDSGLYGDGEYQEYDPDEYEPEALG